MSDAINRDVEEYIKWIEYNGKIIEVSLVYGQGAETVSRVIEKASECFTDITARKELILKSFMDYLKNNSLLEE